jgi:hypothetical protein
MQGAVTSSDGSGACQGCAEETDVQHRTKAAPLPLPSPTHTHTRTNTHPPTPEPQVLVEAVADVVTVQQGCEVAALVQQVLQGASHCGLARAAQPCQAGEKGVGRRVNGGG